MFLFFRKLPVVQDPIRVCVGKEWHRFPSSFFIPQTVSDGKKVEMRFIQSEFRGLLPKPFLKSDKLVEVTRHIPTEMNNLNQEEISRYVDLDSCDYVVDVDMPQSDREPDFRKMVGVLNMEKRKWRFYFKKKIISNSATKLQKKNKKKMEKN